jgi:glutamate carboxypeptidase
MTSGALRSLAQWDRYRDGAFEVWQRITNSNSPSTNKRLCNSLQDLLQIELTALGMTVERVSHDTYGDTVIGRLLPTEGDPSAKIVFIGHSDTVFGDDTVAERPFTADAGRVTGPGVLDMKGGLVIALTGLRMFLDAVDSNSVEIVFVINADEEPGSPESRDVIIDVSRGSDLCLVFEPGDSTGAITVERKGVGIFEFSVVGRPAHAGVEPEKGISAINDLCARIADVVGSADSDSGTTVNIGEISGGTHPYVVAERATCRVDVRVRSVSEQRRIESEFAQLAAREYVPGAVCTLTGHFHRPPFQASKEADVFVDIMMKISSEVGYPLARGSSGGASDANLVSELGVPTIDGMGVHGGGAHSDEEYALADTLKMKSVILAELLHAIARSGNAP